MHVGGPASDQWALLFSNGRAYHGVVYAADPPYTTPSGLARIDERLINRFLFIYGYQFPYQPEPRRLRTVKPEYDRAWMRHYILPGAR